MPPFSHNEKIEHATGFVNAHTHLELSDFDAPIGAVGSSITDWIPVLLQYRQSRTTSEVERAVRRGLEEAKATGTVTVADIVQGDPPFELADELGIELVAFHEIIGVTRQRTVESIGRAERLVDSFHETGGTGQESKHVLGLSPHAPYTICRDLIEAAVSLSAEKNVPLAIHLAESREELQLLAKREGPLRKFLEKIDGWQPDAVLLGQRPLDYLEAMDRASHLFVIHGNYLDDEELDCLAERADRATVVYCPRSHAYFRHDPYPLMKMLDKGVRVAIGTDSRASSPDLAMRAELYKVAELFPELAVETIVELGTRKLGG